MTAIIFICILVLVAVIGLVVGIFAKQADTRMGGWGFFVVFSIITIIVWLANSIVDVEKRTVGIVTEFGKPTATLDSGPHLIAPWAEVHRFPTTNQSIDLNGVDGGPSVNFKFSGGGSGWANLNVVWQIENNDKAVKLWENWKEFDRVSQNVVIPAVIETTSATIGSYSPSEAVKSANLVKYSDEIKGKLNERLAVDGIKIEKVNMVRVDPDSTIQDRVNRQVAADADVERAAK
jgi:regulator of protease activity HflC (stomatin/prohibitin superfamily)